MVSTVHHMDGEFKKSVNAIDTRTISSASSGMRVMVPEPSRSIFWRIRRIVVIIEIEIWFTVAKEIYKQLLCVQMKKLSRAVKYVFQ